MNCQSSSFAMFKLNSKNSKSKTWKEGRAAGDGRGRDGVWKEFRMHREKKPENTIRWYIQTLYTVQYSRVRLCNGYRFVCDIWTSAWNSTYSLILSVKCSASAFTLQMPSYLTRREREKNFFSLFGSFFVSRLLFVTSSVAGAASGRYLVCVIDNVCTQCDASTKCIWNLWQHFWI